MGGEWDGSPPKGDDDLPSISLADYLDLKERIEKLEARLERADRLAEAVFAFVALPPYTPAEDYFAEMEEALEAYKALKERKGE